MVIKKHDIIVIVNINTTTILLLFLLLLLVLSSYLLLSPCYGVIASNGSNKKDKKKREKKTINVRVEIETKESPVAPVFARARRQKANPLRLVFILRIKTNTRSRKLTTTRFCLFGSSLSSGAKFALFPFLNYRTKFCWRKYK